jgi:hypothetical protein
VAHESSPRGFVLPAVFRSLYDRSSFAGAGLVNHRLLPGDTQADCCPVIERPSPTASSAMSAGQSLAQFQYQSGKAGEVLEFLKRTRSELRMLRKARVFRDKVQIFDINGDWFEVTGIGYPDADVVPVLDAVNTAFNRDTIHKPTPDEYKEFKTGRRYTWALDRVM